MSDLEGFAWSKLSGKGAELNASDMAIVRILMKDGLLPDWRGKTCPRCEKGQLKGWVHRRNNTCPKLRCSYKPCHVYINPQHLRPFFTEGDGVGSCPLQTQAAVLMLKLNNMPNSVIHRLLHVNHKAIEDLERRLCDVRKSYVEEHEKEISFGNGGSWKDVEADETTFDERDMSDLEDTTKPIEWEQWQGWKAEGQGRYTGRSWEEVSHFTETESFPIIVKPVESAGSDGVKLCHSPSEAEAHFHLLMTSQRKCGSQEAAVLLQEYLRGTEYIVDHVSRDGVHKTTLVWVYDRRPANGAGFVCFGQKCVASDSPVARQLIAYTRGCLDALRITDGATHTEATRQDMAIELESSMISMV
eukprot:Skav215713  [mRNA]  locus=scaffold2573:404420:408425:- [translate_table: standard]